MAQTDTNSASADTMNGTNVALLREFLSIAAGRSSVEPGRSDRRFSDAQWNENPVLRRVMVLWGEYHDRWVNTDGSWRISERRVLEAGIEPRREGGAPNPRRAKG